ncbi:hypothetical protein [Helicobacter pylori]|uniref:hypothetical protein n=1 Tax=Helicobacter pylori TaxID=210 RepID=UPI001F0F1BA3|nr:hypothetical protein [Helicobacter pylori]
MDKSNKLVIINRAIPGGGKTSLTKQIEELAKSLGHSISVHSTDEYFIQIMKRVSGVMFLIKRNSMNTTKTIKKPSNKL